MDSEFSVELGADDPTLAVPWRSPDGKIAYVDLRQNPEAIEGLEEVLAFPELGELLQALNAPESGYQTAKCDAWFDTLMDAEDEPYEASMKCASYLDVFFADNGKLAGFEEQERSGRQVVQRVRKAAELQARMELVIRRAYFGEEQGLYWTVYVFGYGEDVSSARASWSDALKVLEAAMISGV